MNSYKKPPKLGGFGSKTRKRKLTHSHNILFLGFKFFFYSRELTCPFFVSIYFCNILTEFLYEICK